MVKCWEYFKCGKAKCPAYAREDLQCWLVVGTLCRNEIQGKFLTKIVKCIDCEVFKENLDENSRNQTFRMLKKELEDKGSILFLGK